MVLRFVLSRTRASDHTGGKLVWVVHRTRTELSRTPARERHCAVLEHVSREKRRILLHTVQTCSQHTN